MFTPIYPSRKYFELSTRERTQHHRSGLNVIMTRSKSTSQQNFIIIRCISFVQRRKVLSSFVLQSFNAKHSFSMNETLFANPLELCRLKREQQTERGEKRMWIDVATCTTTSLQQTIVVATADNTKWEYTTVRISHLNFKFVRKPSQSVGSSRSRRL
jgi:hypothetical protein